MKNVHRPRLLYLVHRVPHPPNRGDRIRSYHLLRFLSQRYEVHLACLADEPVSSETKLVLNQLCAAAAVVPVGRTRWLHAARSLTSGHTATEGLFHSTTLRRTVQDWAAAAPFDAVVVFCSSMVQYLDLPELQNTPAIVDLVDVDSQKWLAYAASAGFWSWKKPLFALEGGRLGRLEKSLPRRAAAITLVSEAEADLYRSFCPNDRTHGISNGVDLDYFASCENDGWPGRCLFVGALDYRANVEGLRWFCHHVWPEVHRQLPQATFAIVGRNPVGEVQRMAELPGVDLIGGVPDVRPHVHEAQVVVAPLQIARGIQNKVLEALAMGRPVVASPEALEGLEAKPGVHAVVAQTPRDWVDTIIDITLQPSQRERLRKAARRFVQRRYSWEARLEPFESFFDGNRLASPTA